MLPKELDSLYDQAMERINNQGSEYADLALRVFSWVHHATRPLKVRELQHALAVEQGDISFNDEGLIEEEMLEQLCGGLIHVPYKKTVCFIHYTGGYSSILILKSFSSFPSRRPCSITIQYEC